MRRSLAFLGALTFLGTALGANYILPRAYDEIYQSARSDQYVVITPSDRLSGNTYTFAGFQLRYACKLVEKITCPPGKTPELLGAVSEVVLVGRDVNGNRFQITQKQVDVKVEDWGRQYGVCVGGMGLVTKDYFFFYPGRVEFQDNATRVYYIFPSNRYVLLPIGYPVVNNPYVNSVDGSSYVTVYIKQVCR